MCGTTDGFAHILLGVDGDGSPGRVRLSGGMEIHLIDNKKELIEVFIHSEDLVLACLTHATDTKLTLGQLISELAHGVSTGRACVLSDPLCCFWHYLECRFV